MKTRHSKIREELKRLAKENDGILTAEAVVASAAVPESPLHGSFTWDDTEAANQYRLWQARQLIRVCVEIIPTAPNVGPVEVFVSLSGDRKEAGGGYRMMSHVLSDKDMRATMLKDAVEEMELFQHRYEQLQELSEVFSAMRKVRKSA